MFQKKCNDTNLQFSDYYILKIRGKEALQRFKNEIIQISYSRYIYEQQIKAYYSLKTFLKVVSCFCGKQNVKLIYRICNQTKMMELMFDHEIHIFFSKSQFKFKNIEYDKKENSDLSRAQFFATGRSIRETNIKANFNEIIDYLRHNEIQFERLQIFKVKELQFFPDLLEQKKVKTLTINNYSNCGPFLYAFQFIKSFPSLENLQLYFSIDIISDDYNTREFDQIQTRYLQQQCREEILRQNLNNILYLPKLISLTISGYAHKNLLKLAVIMKQCKDSLQILQVDGLDENIKQSNQEHYQVFATALSRLHNLIAIKLDLFSINLFGLQVLQLTQLQKLKILGSSQATYSVQCIEKARSITNHLLERLTNLKTFTLQVQQLLPLQELKQNSLKCFKFKMIKFKNKTRRMIEELASAQKDGFKIKVKYSMPIADKGRGLNEQLNQMSTFKDQFQKKCPGKHLVFVESSKM
ncbi:hypothetical protein FGO68_gene2627 [Halteria grandinella]|uniref:Uncharacterized protein n=1 Tax=Halteria grandinella TaxID=5974 RepID=A0A8J8NX82_HALGN|nr:hypothetical protein FGO68_gene2627 [Halteria grandinella]